MKTFIIHIEWEGNGKKEQIEIQATDKQQAYYLAPDAINNKSINYGYSFYITEKLTN